MYKLIELVIVSVIYLLVSWLYFREIGNKNVNNFIGVLAVIVMFIITIAFLRYLVRWIHKQLKL